MSANPLHATEHNERLAQFAAAAVPGIIAQLNHLREWKPGDVASEAFDYAEAMVREYQHRRRELES